MRLYGRDVGNGSLAAVTRGFREVLEGAGLLEGFVAIDRSGGSEEDDAPPGALARDGIFTGNLSHLGMMTQGARHERHWVTVTPNSTYVPPKLLDAVVRLRNPRILSASAWGTGVIGVALGGLGFRYVEDGNRWCTYETVGKVIEIHTAHHGVSGFFTVTEEIEKTRDSYQRGEFRVVHFSTTDGERKGTFELVQAWSLLRKARAIPAYAELVLVLDDPARLALKERLRDQGAPPLEDPELSRLEMDATSMSAFLGQQHLLCTPSRGEGFSLLPVQARACGVPVVTTVTTGHSAGHCHGPGVTEIVQDDELYPIDDGPHALAPRVTPEAIATAIGAAYQNWQQLSTLTEAFSSTVASEWSWQAQLGQLVSYLR